MPGPCQVHVHLVGTLPSQQLSLGDAGATAEEAILTLCKQQVEASPVSVNLFGLRWASPSSHRTLWLAPDTDLRTPELQKGVLQFRLRFKPPSPDRLLKLDKQAFNYYFKQVRSDFSGTEVLSKDYYASSSTKRKWYFPMADSAAENDRKLLHYNNVVSMAAFLITFDSLEQDKPYKEFLKNIYSYLPKDLLENFAVKLVAGGKLKEKVEDVVQYCLENTLTVSQLQLNFLNAMETHYPIYYDEYFVAEHSVANGNPCTVRLTMKPPFSTNKPRTKEEKEIAQLQEQTEGMHLSISPVTPADKEPLLEMDVWSHKGVSRAGVEPVRLCIIEEVCYITLSEEKAHSIEISRKNGIPLYFKLKDSLELKSLVSHISGYYRLCEKYIFNLCDRLVYPSLQRDMAFNIHGPLWQDFIDEKFKHKGKECSSPYMLSHSSEQFGLLLLHYQSKERINPEVVHIMRTATGEFKALLPTPKTFMKLEELIAYLKNDERSPIRIKDCLHPSEYDKAPSLLLCRSEAKRKADVIGNEASNCAVEASKVFIPFQQLSRFEQKLFPGRYTDVYKGIWQRGRARRTVAIKQLKAKYQDTKLKGFMRLSYETLAGEDEATLVRAFGTTLAIPSDPELSMCLVTEYFPRGPLNLYLHEQPLTVREVDLVEACTSLARAVWYLEEKNLVHGNIRCSNVFVAEHSDSKFKIKLGDRGMPRKYDMRDIHWLPFELLVRMDQQGKVHKDHCTIRGDVWALATTFWEIFSFGAQPLENADLGAARIRYIDGNRLSKPVAIKPYLNTIYDVMCGCWHPASDQRTRPQAILRDINIVLYKVFNTKKSHTYLTIEDGIVSVPLEPRTDVTAPPPVPARPSAQRESAGQASSNGSLNSQSTYTSGKANSNGTGSGQTCQTILSGDWDGQSSTETIVSRRDVDEEAMVSQDLQFQEQGAVGGVRVPRDTLNPVFTHLTLMRRPIQDLGYSTRVSDRLYPSNTSTPSPEHRGSADPLLSLISRPNSSLENSLNCSQFTSQTSLGSNYSMYSVIQLKDGSELQWNSELPLGDGNFGVVYRGVITHMDMDEVVAVKMLKESDPGALRDVQRELDIMQMLRHENIVRIKAILPDIPRTKIIMEYFKEGSLDRYLQTRRHQIAYPKQLFLYALNIVDGMEYLGSRGIIHRDLAARNILVASEDVVKISDFGLARCVDKDPYVMSSNTNIPIKWLALECITHQSYTFASDVWSFGVTLWEMFSFGKSPDLEGCEGFFKIESVPDEKVGDDLRNWIEKLEQGIRLPVPADCPSSLYAEVMAPCWNKDPTKRPQFSELRVSLERVELRVT